MATLGDYIGLALILALAYGIYLGLQHKEDAKQALKDKRKELKAQGIDISSQGIAIRSNRRGMDRAAYIDATQKKLNEGGAFLAEHANSIKFEPGDKSS
ncbi:hypothetical protein MOBT1_001987 [Malassezia obtusa]|uniref:Uncharacterized protein n=1 Tax=Malassezia obtusa TaxID=76774 RepID=A0AAF0E554_9BASI|nr:hypothetical protein MOBT1_001987 [Malassezia obtusa]